MNDTREDAALRSDMAYIDIEPRDFQMLGTPAALAELFGALAQATGEFTKIHKNREVTIKSDKGSYSFVYAELSESIDATRPALSRHGLDVLQPYTKLGGKPILRTLLTHKGGAMLILACEIPPAANVKDLGGSLSYLRRYTYNALLCLAADEDLDDQPEAGRGETGAQSGPRRTPEVPAASARQNAGNAPGNLRGSQAELGATGPKASTSATTNTGPRTGASTASTPATQGGAPAPKASSPSAAESQTKAATSDASHRPASASEAPTSAGSPTGQASTSSAAGSPAPQTSQQPAAASPASQTPSSQSPAAGSSAPKDATGSAPASAGPTTDNGSPATEEQKLQMHAILEAMRIGRPARNGYVSDLMQSIGVSGKLTMVSAARVLTELEARKAAFLSSPGL